MQEIFEVIGQPIHSLVVQLFIAKYDLRKLCTDYTLAGPISHDDWLNSDLNGIKISFDEECIGRVFLLPRYRGSLIGSLTWNSKREDVIRLLGPPSYEGHGGIKQGKSYIGETAHDLPDYSISCCYDGEAFAISMITIERPKSVIGKRKIVDIRHRE